MIKSMICVNNGEYLVSLIVGKVYTVIENQFDLEHGLLTIIDETGEDYLFPSNWFVERPKESSERINQALERLQSRAMTDQEIEKLLD